MHLAPVLQIGQDYWPAWVTIAGLAIACLIRWFHSLRVARARAAIRAEHQVIRFGDIEADARFLRSWNIMSQVGLEPSDFGFDSKSQIDSFIRTSIETAYERLKNDYLSKTARYKEYRKVGAHKGESASVRCENIRLFAEARSAAFAALERGHQQLLGFRGIKLTSSRYSIPTEPVKPVHSVHVDGKLIPVS
jgi:hypothetical protein